MREAGVNVPRILGESEEGSLYLLEDFGDTLLLDIIKEKGEEGARELIMKSLSQVAEIQRIPNLSRLCFEKSFGERQMMRDLNYFKYEYLKPSGLPFSEDALDDDFDRLLRDIAETNTERGFMYRDFQSRNVMVCEGGEPGFIDFQGGREGPVLYDAVSFLWQAKAGFSPQFREEMLRHYAEAYSRGDKDLASRMLKGLPSLRLLRGLQVLGAYGFRGLVEQKAHFIESIPQALENLSELLPAMEPYPELRRVCRLLVADPRFRRREPGTPLRVEVFSFSYKKGYPKDFSGNGGGFMFDCRAMHNPGRYKEYRELTGKDVPVIDFLEERGEVQPFLRNVFGLVDPAVKRYLQRGFSNLQVGFGCTGGQHRSVYCAEHTAAHLMELFPEADVTLIHREQQ